MPKWRKQLRQYKRKLMRQEGWKEIREMVEKELKPVKEEMEHMYILAALHGLLSSTGPFILQGALVAGDAVNMAVAMGRGAYKCATEGEVIPPQPANHIVSAKILPGS